MVVTATQIGECFAGDGVDAAHINTVLGRYGGPVEVAWATALATPRPGHAAFVAVLQPNLPVQPLTLFVNKATIAGERHGGIGLIGPKRVWIFRGSSIKVFILLH